MTLIDDDFEAVHQERKRKDDNQPLHMKFHRRCTRDLFISRRRKLKSSGFSVHENQTIDNAKLLNRLEQSEKIDKCWSWNGKIWAKSKGPQAKTVRVELFEFTADIVRRSLVDKLH